MPATTATTVGRRARPTTTTRPPTSPATGTSASTATSDDDPLTISLLAVRVELRPDPDTALLLLVVIASALGSYVHTATSFATYVGNQRFTMSWVWWYLLRIFIGISLAVLFYFAVRGGLLSAQAESGALNPYGVAALAALVGLFPKQATDKLREVFENLFRTEEGKGDDERKDKITYPVPRVVEVEPRPPVPAREAVRLKLKGEGFTCESTILIRRLGKDEDPQEVVPSLTRFLSAAAMVVSLKAQDLLPTTELEFIVVNPEPGGGESDPLKVAIGDLPDNAVGPANKSTQWRFWRLWRLLARRRPGRP